MRLNDRLATMHGPGRSSAWRWFPWGLAACMALVFAVNGTMVWFALGTFPGAAGSDGFDLSNHYDRVLDAMQRQATLGWRLKAFVDEAGRPVVTLTDRGGAALRTAQVEAVATRPVGPRAITRLTFQTDAAGRFVADEALGTPGQWDLQIVAHAQDHTFATTRRLVVRMPLPPGRDRAARRIDAARSAG